MMKRIFDFLEHYSENIQFFSLFVLGFFCKLWVHGGKEPITKRFIISEFFVSLFVAITVYAIFDQWLNFNRLFTNCICAWAGMNSTLFSKKTTQVIDAFFDAVKNYIKTKLL